VQDKVCVISGATSGIGRASAEALASRGAQLVLIARNPQKAAETRDAIVRSTGNDAISVVQADFESQAQIRDAATQILADHPRIDLLLNNAGVTNLTRETTVDGIEATFAVNHLAYFLLTNLLLDRILESSGARIVSVASDAHRFGGALDFDDLGLEHGFGWMKAYGRSKGANILFTQELARRIEGSGVTANCLHPGFVRSSLGGQNGVIGKIAVRFAGLFAQSPERGARTSIYLCTSPEVAEVSGGYFAKCRPHRPAAAFTDSAAADRLWKVSEELTGLSH
jgi:NAD(P)-dependent dehydrogenase (short-subunit alcohol dehydrogenase family)